MTPPKVFISYSWNPPQNKEKVLQLAERLSTDFVHVLLDDWDLKEGQDKNQFMEQMVNNPDVIRVLIICNKDYMEKANSKKGGVGIESLIVSDVIYNSAEQIKFIPIIFEYENGKACVPTFIHSRIFIDLSSDAVYEESYELLLRNIFDKPRSKRPPIGTMPAFLLSDEPIFLPTAHKIQTIKNALINEKQNTPLYIQDYLDTFVNSLPSFAIEGQNLNTINLDETILKGIEDLKILRDDFISFTETYLLYSIKIDIEKLHNFFEKLLNYLINLDGYGESQKNFSYLKLDHYRFFYSEFFLTFTAAMIDKEKFEELSYILQNPFLIERKSLGRMEEHSFATFRQYVYFLNEYRNKNLKLNRVSLTADTIKQRATEKYDFDKLRVADILLYFISLLFPTQSSFGIYSTWFPETTCYRFWNISILPKTVSEKYFNKVKILFGVKDKNELQAKAEEIEKQRTHFNDGNFNVPDMKRGLAIDDMCTLK